MIEAKPLQNVLRAGPLITALCRNLGPQDTPPYFRTAIRTYIHVCMLHAYIWTRIQTRLQTYIYSHTHIYIDIHAYSHAAIHIQVYHSISIYIFISLYLYIYI